MGGACAGEQGAKHGEGTDRQRGHAAGAQGGPDCSDPPRLLTSCAAVFLSIKRPEYGPGRTRVTARTTRSQHRKNSYHFFRLSLHTGRTHPLGPTRPSTAARTPGPGRGLALPGCKRQKSQRLLPVRGAGRRRRLRRGHPSPASPGAQRGSPGAPAWTAFVPRANGSPA